MKKLVLTACAAGLFAIGAIAQQVQDTSSTNLRQGVEQTEDDMNRTGNEIQQGAEQTGEELQQGAEQTGDQIQQGAEQTGDQIQQGAEPTEDQLQQTQDSVKNEMDQNSPSPQSMNEDPNATPTDNMMSSNTPPQHEIEVLEDKEGPDNQVVYKYQGGLYYVDRDQKQLVKIEESQLKDAEHKAIISEKQ